MTFEYGKALRGHDGSRGRYRVFGSNGPIGWTDTPLVPGPGVILGRKGAYRGVRFSTGPFFVIDTAYYLVPKSEHLDMRWLYYAVQYYKLGEIDDGSPIPSTTRAAVSVLEVLVPPLNEQRAIAHILGTLDDKIELNRRMNETLEEMARALFKSWFVDFDPVRRKAEGRDPGLPKHLADLFPSRFVDSELGEIPEGWGTHQLTDLLTLDKGLSYKGQFLTDVGLPMVNLGCFLGNGRFSPSALKPYSGEHKPRHVVQPGDLVIANTDITQKRTVIGSPGIVPKLIGCSGGIFSHHVFAARFKEGCGEWRDFTFHLLLQPVFRERAMGFATGTTVLALPREAVLDLPSVVPPPALLCAFTKFSAECMGRQWQLHEEEATLASLRDALLPKLISGELRVKDADRFLAKVTA